MSDFLKIKIVHSQSHTIMPKITIGILIILGVILLIQSYLKAKKENRTFMDFKDKKFFIEGYDKKKLFGTLILLVLYISSMKLIGFIIAGIIFLSLFNILYADSKDKKSIMLCIGIAIIETMVVWFIFGYIFDITLP